jgi:hypothetical protein
MNVTVSDSRIRYIRHTPWTRIWQRRLSLGRISKGVGLCSSEKTLCSLSIKLHTFISTGVVRTHWTTARRHIIVNCVMFVDSPDGQFWYCWRHWSYIRLLTCYNSVWVPMSSQIRCNTLQYVVRGVILTLRLKPSDETPLMLINHLIPMWCYWWHLGYNDGNVISNNVQAIPVRLTNFLEDTTLYSLTPSDTTMFRGFLL